MNRDHYTLKAKLNARAQQAAENLRMAKLELSYTPLFWVVVAAIAVILLVIRK